MPLLRHWQRGGRSRTDTVTVVMRLRAMTISQSCASAPEVPHAGQGRSSGGERISGVAAKTENVRTIVGARQTSEGNTVVIMAIVHWGDVHMVDDEANAPGPGNGRFRR